MSKVKEREYLPSLGQAGIDHVVNKPFSDEHCGTLLIQLGQVMELLPPPPGKLLDLGCGAGSTTSEFFARRGYDVVGVDISEYAINLAKSTPRASLPKGSLAFIASDYEKMPYRGEFNIAVFFDALHHAENINLALSSVQKALHKGGVCLIAEPGLGHASHPQSREAVKKYGVTEQSLVPRKLMKSVTGFTKIEVFPSLSLLNTVLSREKENIKRPLLQTIFSMPGARFLAALGIIGPYRFANGIIRLTK